MSNCPALIDDEKCLRPLCRRSGCAIEARETTWPEEASERDYERKGL